MAEIDPATLLPNDHVIQAVLDGTMTQLTRGQAYAEESDTFTIDDQEFVVDSVEKRQLGDLTDADAQREGSADLDAYKERMVTAHGGSFEWDDSAEVFTHQFEAV